MEIRRRWGGENKERVGGGEVKGHRLVRIAITYFVFFLYLSFSYSLSSVSVLVLIIIICTHTYTFSSSSYLIYSISYHSS